MFEKKQSRPFNQTRPIHRTAALQQTTRQAIVEACEPRRMFDAALPQYTVIGTSSSDTITVGVYKKATGKYDVIADVNGKSTVHSNVKPGQVNIYGLSGNDKITVRSHFDTAALYVEGGEGNDKLTLLADGDTSMRKRFSAGVNFRGGNGADSFVLDSKGHLMASGIESKYTVADRKIHVAEGNSLYATMKSTDVELQEIKTGGKSNQVSVNQTVIPTNVLGGIGVDSVAIGKSGLVDGVQGKLYVNGGGGISDTLTFDETGRQGYMSYELDSSHFKAATAPSVTFDDVDKVVLHGGSGGSQTWLKSAKDGTALYLNGNGGDDIFALAAGDFDTIQASKLVINGGTGDDTTIVNDVNDKAKERDFMLSDYLIKRTGSKNTDISGINRVILHASSSENDVSVYMSRQTAFDVRGGDPGINSFADRIRVMGTKDAPFLTITGIGTGYYSAVLKQTVSFYGFERFTGDENAGGAITGTVYDDKNGNGVRDAGENGIKGRVVFIDTDYDTKLDANERRNTTDAQGNFVLPGLASGNYSLMQVLPDGSRQTTNINGPAMNVHVGQHKVTTDRLFGSTSTAAVRGKVFVDKDADGKLDGNEYGNAGWRVYVDSDHDGVFDTSETSVLTSINGEYTLSGVAGGQTHQLRIAPVAGYKPYAVNDRFTYTPAGSTMTGVNFSLLKNV